MPTVTKIPATKPFPRLPRVAAYCRVSSSKEVQTHSLETQIKYYTEKIKQTPGWILPEFLLTRNPAQTSLAARNCSDCSTPAKMGAWI
jgi:hypothetical protein